MILGFLTGKYEDIAKARRMGFDAIELHAAAFGDPAAGDLDAKKISEAKALCEKHDVRITALAHYRCAGSPADVDLAPKEFSRVFDAAESLGVKVIASMSGFDANLDWDGNIRFWADRFGPVSEIAEKRGLRIAFENWMGFGGKLPFRPRNMGGCPDLWDEWFATVPSEALGIEFDPSHLYWQGIDHVRAVKEYGKRIYHVHAKDTEMLPENRYRGGINGRCFRFRIPGYGEIDWPGFVSALVEAGYDGGVAIEHEDPVFGGDRFDEGLARGREVLRSLVEPDGREES
jgi:sugar phosphate isomerase/epimerase